MDADWYRSRYPDVAESGMDPVVHFSRHGWCEGRLPRPNAAVEAEERLWSQDAAQGSPALAELEALAAGRGHPDPLMMSYACWALGRWYAAAGEPQRARTALEKHFRGRFRLPGHAGPALLLAELRIQTGARLRARRFLKALDRAAQRGARCAIPCPERALAWCNWWARKGGLPSLDKPRTPERLQCLNAALAQYGLGALERRDAAAAPGLDNVAGANATALQSRAGSRPRVSIIVPAYNAEHTLGTALRGLLAQSWPWLEVLVVDDASSDGTVAVAEAFAQADERVRILRQGANRGAYAARNAGLQAARGAYITTHDADDWSHPEKIARQAATLEDQEAAVASVSHWVRCDDQLVFSRWRMEEGRIYRNVSSLMFRRSVVEALGFWDNVRVGADTEYYHRIRHAFGEEAVVEVLPGVPLAFGRSGPDSLTQAGPTHLRTQFGGVRKDYHDASLRWHARASSPEELYVPAEPEQRPFPAPPELCR